MSAGFFASGLSSGNRLHQLEIHLLFERIHFVNLHRDFIAERYNAAAASANEMVSSGVKNKKIILDG